MLVAVPGPPKRNLLSAPMMLLVSLEIIGSPRGMQH
jgi:hypothetical protein